jgi:enoyl-CoA hydratase
VSDSILVERDGQIATVTLNRPRQRNAVTFGMWGKLIDIARQLDADPEVRVVVLRGAGHNAFSAGADISEFDSYRSNSRQARQYAEAFDGALEAVAAIGQPTISLIRGVCVGGGLELATATDLRIASDDSRFGVPIARLGILVGYHEMRRLVGLVGPGAALDLLLTARLIGGADALRIRLISALTSPDDVEQVTYSLARDICNLAPLSARWHKQILRTVLTNPGLVNLSPEERALPFACFDTEDFKEGRRAFLDKRPPSFRGK